MLAYMFIFSQQGTQTGPHTWRKRCQDCVLHATFSQDKTEGFGRIFLICRQGGWILSRTMAPDLNVEKCFLATTKTRITVLCFKLNQYFVFLWRERYLKTCASTNISFQLLPIYQVRVYSEYTGFLGGWDVMNHVNEFTVSFSGSQKVCSNI